MVFKGVPNSCAAAAASPPSDFNSCSLNKICCRILKASFLCELSIANLFEYIAKNTIDVHNANTRPRI